tara:strand:+ start:16439 stop:17272 length:834 start_codon:yes stop_codon:yes gene_type:complete
MFEKKRSFSLFLLCLFTLVLSLPSCTVIPNKEITITSDLSAIELGKMISSNSRKEFSLTLLNDRDDVFENSWETHQVSWCSTPNFYSNKYHYTKPFERLCSEKGGVLDHVGKVFVGEEKSIKTFWAGICTSIQNDIDPIFVASYGPPKLYGDREPDCDGVLHISTPEKMTPLTLKVYEPFTRGNQNWAEFTEQKLGALSAPDLLEKLKRFDRARQQQAHDRNREVDRILNSKGLLICNSDKMYAITSHRSGDYILGHINGKMDKLIPLRPHNWFLCN